MNKETVLYYFPGACARVTLNALEEIGQPFRTVFIDPRKAQQNSPEYLAINPKGKVPALGIGGRVLAENAAILLHLHAQYPRSGLLPETDGRLGSNEPVEDLVWCAATLHPMTRMVAYPARFTVGADAVGVAELGKHYYQPVLKRLAERLENGSWWYGDQWSIVDVYLYWNYSTAAIGGLDLSAYPAIARHAVDVRRRPSFLRALAREQADIQQHAMQMPPGWM
jgi:glutathione S-transferase